MTKTPIILALIGLIALETLAAPARSKEVCVLPEADPEAVSINLSIERDSFAAQFDATMKAVEKRA